MTQENPVDLIKKIEATIHEQDKTNAELIKVVKAAADTAGADAKAAVAKAEELAKKVSANSEAILEAERKLADGVKAGKAAPTTLGQMVIKSDGYKDYLAGARGRFRIEANTLSGQEGSPPENSDNYVQRGRAPGVVMGAFRALRMRDLIPARPVTGNAFDYLREQAYVNNAAETAENTEKPESDAAALLYTVNIRTIAHLQYITKQLLADAPYVQNWIDTRMRHGVENRFDAQVISGNGVGQNLSGILASGNHTAFTPLSDNRLDEINRMIESVRAADFTPTGIVLSVADWHEIERQKAGSAPGGSDLLYTVGNPTGVMGPVLWGLPVVVTNNLQSGKAIVSAFDISHEILDRQGVVVEMFEQDGDNVKLNLVTVRAEMRGALASTVPAACFAGDLIDSGS